MIINLPNTTAAEIDARLVQLRNEGGAVALGRVLTLVIVIDAADPAAALKEAVDAANEASREHPCRVLVLAEVGEADDDPCLDAEIRVGGDAGASEVVVLRARGPLVNELGAVVIPLLLPDAPIVAWWANNAPQRPADHPIGRLASRRITDSLQTTAPLDLLQALRTNYVLGDTDLAWARVTLWRGLLAAALDQPPYEQVAAAEVTGQADHPSLYLLGGWLADRLRCPVRIHPVAGAQAITQVRLLRASGDVLIDRADGKLAEFTAPGAAPRKIALPIRRLSEALIEELRRLDPDEIYEAALQAVPEATVTS
ncbi:MAG: glucose-6-phosphate dehydrogenase assembly protein OpcA [Promicromonosporaceae bacterium]|nr:glucose-6-phosphate dehydrogenase assembly protein OpcA [Promicromonosporaceae bacterium]